MVTVVIFAMIAGFLALQLYRVLGKQTGHEHPLPKSAEDRVVGAPLARAVDAVPEIREPAARTIDGGAEQGLRAIVAADPGFDVARFIDGAKQAYRMVLDAYWKGDEETLAWLCEDDVRASFAEAIAERAAAGHVLDNRLVSIERAIISDARLEGKRAFVTVRIDADIAAITRDADGNLVSGSMTDAVPAHESWTFVRTLKTSDPNWKLADTDEA